MRLVTSHNKDSPVAQAGRGVPLAGSDDLANSAHNITAHAKYKASCVADLVGDRRC